MIGAISRAVATVIVFPYIRAKVIIMSRKNGEGGGSGSAASTSIFSSLVTILKDDGVSALFQVMLVPHVCCANNRIAVSLDACSYRVACCQSGQERDNEREKQSTSHCST